MSNVSASENHAAMQELTGKVIDLLVQEGAAPSISIAALVFGVRILAPLHSNAAAVAQMLHGCAADLEKEVQAEESGK